MPRFYFDLVDGLHSGDAEGAELQSVIEARLEAVRLAGAYVRDNPELVQDSSVFRVLVFDEGRTLLTTITVAGADSPTMQDRIKAETNRLG